MKKYLKQVLTWILCFALCLGNAVAVHAANESNTSGITFYVELDTEEITASAQDQTVIMKLMASSAVDVDGMAFTVSQDEPLSFTAVSGGAGIGAFSEADVNLKTGYAAWGSSSSENVTGVTELAVITFTVPANTPVGEYTVGIEGLELTKDYGTVWEETASATDILKVTKATEAEGYTAGITADNVTVEKGTEVSIQVSAGHVKDTVFNADEIVISYDQDKLAFNQSSSSLYGAKVKDDTVEGKLTIANHGADRNLGDIYTLVFGTIETGTATVKLDSAGFIDKEGASESDLLAATINPGTVNLTINEAQFNVTLPGELVGLIDGNTQVEAGSSYEFKVLNTNYDYVFSATMNGESVEVTSMDGVNFIVDEVTADLTINLVSQTPKSYSVTFEGNGAEDITAADGNTVGANATYGTDYVFKVDAVPGYGYPVSMTINGEAYIGYTVENNVYTIPGGAITGAVVVTVEKTQGAFTVSVTGEGAGIAAGYKTTAEAGEAYVLTVVPEAGYLYTVTATMGGNLIELDIDGTTYTIPAVDGDVVFKIDRKVDTSGVEVNDKVTIDSEKVYAVSYKTKLADNKVPTYDGNPMYWSENHNAYIYLTIAGTLSEEEAEAVIGIADQVPITVADSSDINGSGKLDASDAQYVWNMYNAEYSEFTEVVTMIDFIKADRNADYKIDTEDAAYIVNEILGTTAN